MIPLCAGASGQSILAFLDPEQQAKICKGPLQRFTPYTITDPERLTQRLAEIRQQGYVITCQEVYIGSLGIAAPVFGKNGNVIGSVSLSGPMERISEEHKQAIRDELMRTAKEITARMSMLNH